MKAPNRGERALKEAKAPKRAPKLPFLRPSERCSAFLRVSNSPLRKVVQQQRLDGMDGLPPLRKVVQQQRLDGMDGLLDAKRGEASSGVVVPTLAHHLRYRHYLLQFIIIIISLVLPP